MPHKNGSDNFLPSRNAGILLPLMLVAAMVAGCGGGGSSGGLPPPPPPADFSMSVQPGAVQVAQGSSQAVQVNISSINGFSGSVSITASGMPSGVTVSPVQFSVSPGGSQIVTFSASASAPLGQANVVLTATSGTLNHSATLRVDVVSVTAAGHAPGRTRYLRTDALYDPNALQFFPPHLAAYDPHTKRFFVSNVYLDRIEVFDAATEVEIAKIFVPLPFGMDIAPDGTRLFVGSTFGDLYIIDPVGMTLVQRVAGASIGPQGYLATGAFVLADGKLALLGPTGPPVDGSRSFAIWDSSSNALNIVTPLANIGQFIVSGDRTKVIAASTASDGTIVIYDPATGSTHTVGFVASHGSSIVSHLVASPDGKKFFALNEAGDANSFDLATLSLLGTFSIGNTGIVHGCSGAAISRDGGTLYVMTQTGDLLAFDSLSLIQKGWIPSFRISDLQQYVVPNAVDETGLIAGPIGHGVAFLDAAQLQPGSHQTEFNLGYPTPFTGPLAGGTQIQAEVLTGVPAPTINSGQVFVGAAAATNVAVSASFVSATTSPSAFAGAADFTLVLPDHSIGIMPETFSYGPTIVEITDSSTAEGGAQGALFGYGLGQQASDFRIMVGGQAATVTTFHPFPPLSPYPFAMQTAVFTVPPGTPGTAVDVTITTASGSTTATGAFHYLAPTHIYQRPGAAFQEGLYDARRRVIYFTDQTMIQVFSPVSGTWLNPIVVPNASRLLAVALSPDGNTLAVSDEANASISVLNPDSPGAVSTFHVRQNANDNAIGLEPCGLAVTNTGVIYYATFEAPGAFGNPAFHKLVIPSGSITDLGNIKDLGPNDNLMRVRISPDGSRVYVNESGITYIVQTVDDSVSFNPRLAFGEGQNELDISGDGTRLISENYFADANLNPVAAISYLDRETWLPQAVSGQKLSHDGSVLFQPFTQGVDIVDANTGLLRHRVQLPVSVADVYDALVVDDTDGLLFFIASGSIGAVEIHSLPSNITNAAELNRVSEARPNMFVATDLGRTNRITLPQPNSLRRKMGGYVWGSSGTSNLSVPIR